MADKQDSRIRRSRAQRQRDKVPRMKPNAWTRNWSA